jgi:methylenetetrahydrofolate--tRNA-(uracil-5-)-methyltransferase
MPEPKNLEPNEKTMMSSTLANSLPVTVVGAGLAGCEAAMALARMGVPVRLMEMKPARYSPAHSLPGPAELVCSNSLKSDSLDTAHGLLKDELRQLGSVLMEAAESSRVPAGSALAVDRTLFSEAVSKRLEETPRLEVLKGYEISEPPLDQREVILATGPLTSHALSQWLHKTISCGDDLYFYDALAPIVEADSLDRSRVFFASRWGKGRADYVNCPMNKEEYMQLVSAIREADRTDLHDFEDARYFEACLPLEVLAERGDDVLAFGPMRPVGLKDSTGKKPYAILQLRTENKEFSAFNLVGCQTKMTREAQKMVFRMIPGLQRAQFLRFGAMHRNLFVNAPVVLDDRLALRTHSLIHLTGQMVGVEGYVESAAMGLLVGLMVAHKRMGLAFTAPPSDTAVGALYAHVRGGDGKSQPYEPMNIHFGLLPAQKAHGRKNRRKLAIQQAQASFGLWLEHQKKENRS